MATDSGNEHITRAIMEGSSSLGITLGEEDTTHISAAALHTLQAVREGKTSEITETAASSIETLLKSKVDNSTADEIQGNMMHVAEKIAPALTSLGIDESKSKLLSEMVTTVSAKLVRTMQQGQGEGGDDNEHAGSDGDTETSLPYMEGVVNEFCARVYMLLYKLALYARPLDELATYGGEPEEYTACFEEVVEQLTGAAVTNSTRLYTDETFQAAYIERIRAIAEEAREGAEDQLLLWFDNVVKSDSVAFKRETMQNWHDACKNSYALLNTRVPSATADAAIVDAVPSIYPLHAAKLLEFWKEETFLSSKKEVLSDLEQINMLSAVSSGLPEPMQRIMGKLARSSAYDKLANVNGEIDQTALMQAAIETVSSLSAKDTMDLMNSIPDMLRSFSGPMSSALNAVGGMDGAANVLSSSGMNTILQQAMSGGAAGVGSGFGAGAGAGAADQSNGLDDTFA